MLSDVDVEFVLQKSAVVPWSPADEGFIVSTIPDFPASIVTLHGNATVGFIHVNMWGSDG